MGDQLGSPDDEGLSFSCLDDCSVRLRNAPLGFYSCITSYAHPVTAYCILCIASSLSGRTSAACGRTAAASGLAGNYRPRNAAQGPTHRIFSAQVSIELEWVALECAIRKDGAMKGAYLPHSLREEVPCDRIRRVSRPQGRSRQLWGAWTMI